MDTILAFHIKQLCPTTFCYKNSREQYFHGAARYIKFFC